jgi:hypothetical protein
MWCFFFPSFSVSKDSVRAGQQGEIINQLEKPIYYFFYFNPIFVVDFLIFPLFNPSSVQLKGFQFLLKSLFHQCKALAKQLKGKVHQHNTSLQQLKGQLQQHIPFLH